MEYRKLGKTSLEVSKICLGTMTWGEQNTEEEAHQQLDRALEAGVNFIDTAEMYPVPPKAETQGLTEEYLGSWLNKRGKRDDLVLASKVVGRSDMNYLRGGPRLNASQIKEACEASLKRLQTDYIDLYQVHWPERKTNFFGQLGYKYRDDQDAIAIEETLTALNELVKEGKVRHLGISNETPWGMHEYLRVAAEKQLPRIQSIQNPYNLLNRTFEVGLAEMAIREDVGLLAYSPLGFGVLSGKYLNQAKPSGARLTLYERFQRYTSPLAEKTTRHYVELAKKLDMDPAQMALAFVNDRPFVTSNIIGATTLEQLESNLASAEITLTEEQLEAIERIHLEQPNPCP
ncbi:Predicted oxidoreductase [Marinospirillum celere]|uniref:Protein tas n=1 Tax=Marinospirillum celere TaxID=1122252 RepID=A0A1I1FLS8_9GAMM|nr:NADP(H)-dependent aldo-keto reductase [Marinospirillum celere]SFB97990.1 Predicted oxidoreductase [Marinospirillum celere]